MFRIKLTLLSAILCGCTLLYSKTNPILPEQIRADKETNGKAFDAEKINGKYYVFFYGDNFLRVVKYNEALGVEKEYRYESKISIHNPTVSTSRNRFDIILRAGALSVSGEWIVLDYNLTEKSVAMRTKDDHKHAINNAGNEKDYVPVAFLSSEFDYSEQSVPRLMEPQYPYYKRFTYYHKDILYEVILTSKKVSTLDLLPWLPKHVGAPVLKKYKEIPGRPFPTYSCISTTELSIIDAQNSYVRCLGLSGSNIYWEIGGRVQQFDTSNLKMTQEYKMAEQSENFRYIDLVKLDTLNKRILYFGNYSTDNEFDTRPVAKLGGYFICSVDLQTGKTLERKFAYAFDVKKWTGVFVPKFKKLFFYDWAIVFDTNGNTHLSALAKSGVGTDNGVTFYGVVGLQFMSLNKNLERSDTSFIEKEKNQSEVRDLEAITDYYYDRSSSYPVAIVEYALQDTQGSRKFIYTKNGMKKIEKSEGARNAAFTRNYSESVFFDFKGKNKDFEIISVTNQL